MKIKIICVGRIGNNTIEKIIKKYLVWIKAKIKIEIIEIKEFKIKNQETKLKKESEQILNIIDNSELNIILDEKGKEYTSIEFSKQIEDQMIISKNICFIIGGAFGLHKELKNKFKLMALSRLTFQHDLALVLLVEQIYRAFTIIYKEPYHK